MKVSNVTVQTLADYLRLEDANDTMLEPVLTAAKQNVATLTGLTVEELDEHEDITPAVLILAQDFFDNRQYQSNSPNYANRAVESIIASHRVNLV